MQTFLINTEICGVHTVKIFEVPDEILEGTTCYGDVIDKAGLYFVNHIDLVSCTGNYQHSIIPLSLLKNVRDLRSDVSANIDILKENVV